MLNISSEFEQNLMSDLANNPKCVLINEPANLHGRYVRVMRSILTWCQAKAEYITTAFSMCHLPSQFLVLWSS